MLRLIVMSGPQDGQEAVCPGFEACIGAAPENELCLPHDPYLAAAGAHIGYTDGILSVQQGELEFTTHPGELFRLGCTWLKVFVEE